MTLTEIRKKVAAYMEVGFTQKEAFQYIREAARAKKVNPNSYREMNGRLIEEGKKKAYDAKKYLH